MLFLIACISLACAQDQIYLNNYFFLLPPSMDFDFSQGGEDWGPGCHQSIQESPIDIDQNFANYTEVNEDNSAFVSLIVSNPPIGDNFIEVDIAGTENFFVFRGTATWNLTKMARTRQVLMDFHVTAPAEHPFNGQRYPLELHMRYGLPRPAGLLSPMSYIAVWFEAGDANPVIAEIIAKGEFDLSPLFPDSGVLDDYFYYTGSEDRPLPICYPDIGWVIPNYVLQASSTQIAYFESRYSENLAFAGGRGNIRDLRPNVNPIYHFRSIQTPTQSFLA